ncbi:MAG: hypothetical protein A3J55_01885 [Candidatus Ryanbacteria bacterium RIFCSPHIGHO2_02_FULL_45_17b]|nr:MAG: hypothetical protein A3J55_01885 [Candidatus Ryanbacteria bacterium RIFCSPHIGHO2_02_FULL_45_17b]
MSCTCKGGSEGVGGPVKKAAVRVLHEPTPADFHQTTLLSSKEKSFPLLVGEQTCRWKKN